MFAMGWMTFGKWTTILLLVVGSMSTYTWFIYKSGKDSMIPQINRIATDFQEFKNQVQINSTSADKNFEVLTQVYVAELNAMEKEYVLQIDKLNTAIDSYASQRLRDKNSIRTAEDRISSLSEAAERFAGTNQKARELSERLERLEAGVLTRIVGPAERGNARLGLCQEYLRTVQGLKEKYEALQNEATTKLEVSK